MGKPTKTADEILSDLAEVLDVPRSAYEAADRSYKSVSAWLQRPQSRFADCDGHVYTQGSFRLGTANRPLNDEDDYDLDVVCEFVISKSSRTQKSLLDDLGHELKLYAKSRSLDEPERWRRCWTLNYADDAQFHMDVLPCLPDAADQRSIRATAALSLVFVEKSVAIPDSEHPNYQHLSRDWPVSNPNGYAEWFRQRIKVVFDERRRTLMMKEAKADVAEIPEFRVKTPLQAVIQILKRHRDFAFSSDHENRPTSIILTTLAAHAYQQQRSIVDALFGILANMDQYIEERNGRYWIPNPTDPRENFADAWNDSPPKREAFYDWLRVARTDFQSASEKDDVSEIVDILSPRIGRKLVKEAAARRPRPFSPAAIVKATPSLFDIVMDAPHRKPMPWPYSPIGQVSIRSATAQRDGWRPMPVLSGAAPLDKHFSLRFEAQTNIARPFKIYWQIVNTGDSAKAARGLRGNFEEQQFEQGGLVKKETTLYPGVHSIECFIVENGLCLARSGPFIVQIH
ncbi:MAG TPA: nucleotidyltransferase [Clostridia bacterium]|nr:nucleotidyltransferase [Clostridia bacterium]